MKKLIILFCLMSVTISVFAQASDIENERRFSIQVNPIVLVGDIAVLAMPKDNGKYGFSTAFEFQYALNKYLSLSIEPRFGMGKGIRFSYGYGSSGPFLNGDKDKEEYIYLALNPGLLYKPFGTMLEGWYVGVFPTVGWRNVTRDVYDSNPSINDNFLIAGIAGGSGYQWVFNNCFTLSAGAAVGKTWDIGNNKNTGTYEDKSKVFFDIISLDLKVGYSF
jgi:hypothetical protein